MPVSYSAVKQVKSHRRRLAPHTAFTQICPTHLLMPKNLELQLLYSINATH